MKKLTYGLICCLILVLTVGCSNSSKKERTKESQKEIQLFEQKGQKKYIKVVKEQKEKEEKQVQDIQNILSIDDPQKYVDAYYAFSMKGNPMPPEQRGDGAVPETAGLSDEEYYEIRWGICDYYGNAFNQGLITAEQNNTAQKLAMDKLALGGYGNPSDKKEPVNITSDNVINYLDQYVRSNSPWELSYPSVQLADDDISQQVYFESGSSSAARGYFIVTPAGEITRFSNSGELLKPLEEIDWH